MGRHTEITVEEGSINVYADLRYADAAVMQRKSQRNRARDQSPTDDAAGGR
jgi:hypothetical protein